MQETGLVESVLDIKNSFVFKSCHTRTITPLSSSPFQMTIRLSSSATVVTSLDKPHSIIIGLRCSSTCRADDVQQMLINSSAIVNLIIVHSYEDLKYLSEWCPRRDSNPQKTRSKRGTYTNSVTWADIKTPPIGTLHTNGGAHTAGTVSSLRYATVLSNLYI